MHTTLNMSVRLLLQSTPEIFPGFFSEVGLIFESLEGILFIKLEIVIVAARPLRSAVFEGCSTRGGSNFISL